MASGATFNSESVRNSSYANNPTESSRGTPSRPAWTMNGTNPETRAEIVASCA